MTPNHDLLSRRRFLRRSATAAGIAAFPWGLSLPAAAQSAGDASRQRVEAAIPSAAGVRPLKPRKLLVFGLNVNYGGHPSIATASLAFTLMGRKTGSFETVISKDPSVFLKESLSQFDAVFFNNNVGNLFEDPDLRQNLIDFVYSGGGLMGVHGASVAFTRWPGAAEDWPEFGVMIGARGANHRASDEHVFIALDDPSHPLVRTWNKQGFDYRDEFFRVHEPYSRDRLRVLLTIDNDKTEASQGPSYGKLIRADKDYALAWVRHYGRGRIFYCTIAHNPSVFWDPKMLQFYLDATQFVLGDLQAPTIPSARLTPALRAQESLGWRSGMFASSAREATLFELIETASRLGLPYLGGLSSQKVGKEIPKPFDQLLSPDDLKAIRLKLDAASVRLLTYELTQSPPDEIGWRRAFEFGRRVGAECMIAGSSGENFALLEKLCDQHDLQLAVRCGSRSETPWLPDLSDAAEALRNRSPRLGVCADLGAWMRAGVDPTKAVQKLKNRLLAVRVRDLSDTSPHARDLPWGKGIAGIGDFLRELRRLNLKPSMIGMDFPGTTAPAFDEAKQSLSFLNETSLKLVERPSSPGRLEIKK